MKITVEVDCTPEEARAFLGLPDVKPLQATVMARIEQQMLQAADSLTPDALLRSWFTTMPQLSNQMQDMFSRMLGTPPAKP